MEEDFGRVDRAKEIQQSLGKEASELMIGCELGWITVGAALQLGLGTRVRRQYPISNRRISEDARMFDAECTLHIACSWRIDVESRPLVSWSGRERQDVNHWVHSQLLAGPVRPRVIKAAFASDSLVLTVSCDSGVHFHAFPDVTDNGDDFNLYVRRAKTVLVLDSHLRWQREDDPDADSKSRPPPHLTLV